MPDVETLINALSARGHRLALVDGRPSISPSAGLTPADLAALATHRPAIIQILLRLDVFRRLYAAPIVWLPDCPRCLVLRPGLPWIASSCWSCGMPTPESTRPSRCPSCLLACSLLWLDYPTKPKHAMFSTEAST